MRRIIKKISVRRLTNTETVSCNSCGRHNYKGSSVDKERFIDEPMNEIKVRNQGVTLCNDCLTELGFQIKALELEKNEGDENGSDE